MITRISEKGLYKGEFAEGSSAGRAGLGRGRTQLNELAVPSSELQHDGGFHVPGCVGGVSNPGYHLDFEWSSCSVMVQYCGRLFSA